MGKKQMINGKRSNNENEGLIQPEQQQVSAIFTDGMSGFEAALTRLCKHSMLSLACTNCLRIVARWYLLMAVMDRNAKNSLTSEACETLQHHGSKGQTS
jgi:hypothetical protein